MGLLGLHLRLTDQELAYLEGLPDAEAIYDHITEELEEAKFDSGDVAETDKSWSYIHGALMGCDPDGAAVREPDLPELAVDSPARYVIIGTEEYVLTDDFYVGLSRSDDAQGIAKALEAISSEELQARVLKTHKHYGASGDANDCAEYAASWYSSLVEFFRTTAEKEHHVIFTVSF